MQFSGGKLCRFRAEKTHPIEREPQRSAHYYKDLVQDAYKAEHSGYFHIDRGVFILAAIHYGLDVEKYKGDPDAWISV